MNEVRDILTILARIVVEISYALGILYIPERDAPPSPFPDKKPLPEPKETPPPPRPETNAFNYGVAKPGEHQETVEYIEVLTESENGPEWDIMRWNGEFGTPDFSAWDATDETVIAEAKLTAVTRKTYERVRPYVVQGLTNSQIESKTGLSDGTVKHYAKLVRKAFKLRLQKMAVTPSPT